jgi:hypothetical protein
MGALSRSGRRRDHATKEFLLPQLRPQAKGDEGLLTGDLVVS